MEKVATTPLHILLAEDTEDDVIFFRHALTVSRLRTTLAHVHDGQEAIAYLRAEPPFSDRTKHPFPEMIVTDLKMPRADGFDLLTWLNKHPDCAVIPTLVLSSSYMDSDVAKAYQLGANAFLSKPSDINQYAELLLATYMFWSRCQRPPAPKDHRCH